MEKIDKILKNEFTQVTLRSFAVMSIIVLITLALTYFFPLG